MTDRSVSFHSGVGGNRNRLKRLPSGHVPTSEELGEVLLNAAAVGNRSKLKRLIEAGL